ncbi:MAG TPA: tRNA pseudouridine(55) synthase TruB, partial [Hyphomicrobiaceae bacterium]|nr:tRNA pseudouridine(55) synthase TruB [Hyphomicrobiaceae bacterium]
GQRAYDLARSGEEVEIEARPVSIDRLDLIDAQNADEAILEAVCGRGTYVRAIARDLGRLLGCRGHVTALRRTRVGDFNESRSVSLDALIAACEADDGGAALASYLLPVEAALSDIPHLAVQQSDAARIARGQPIIIRGRDAPTDSPDAYVTTKGTLLALGYIERGEFHPTRVFN